jgi:hypothetical protein
VYLVFTKQNSSIYIIIACFNKKVNKLKQILYLFQQWTNQYFCYYNKRAIFRWLFSLFSFKNYFLIHLTTSNPSRVFDKAHPYMNSFSNSLYVINALPLQAQDGPQEFVMIIPPLSISLVSSPINPVAQTQ